MIIKIILYDIGPISLYLIYVTCKNNLPLRCHYRKKNVPNNLQGGMLKSQYLILLILQVNH